MLGPFLSVTMSAHDLDAVEDAYTGHLGYQTVRRTHFPKPLADAMQAPRCADAEMLELLPKNGNGAVLRFVRQPRTAGYKPLTTWGWNATEISVAGVYDLAERLADSPFEIIGPPAPLGIDGTSPITAMQVIGPADEVLYLTEIADNVEGFDLPLAKVPVDRVFIMVIGGADIASQSAFFKQHFSLEAGPEMVTKITVIANALGQPARTPYTLSTVALNGQCLIEVDALPQSQPHRPRQDGFLAPGIAAVGMAVADPSAFGAPVGEDAGGAFTVIEGPGGALFELRQAG